jgi:hypothetical protein
MWLTLIAVFAAVALFLLGYAVASRIARRRLFEHARRAARVNDELERRLIKLGAGIGVGA